ncbi:MAG: hypothetical protein OSB69_21795, partial [Alphaproteobacteria bacterium]|nr:hypothetical protein [Alphaproteobacteria bacterium]
IAFTPTKSGFNQTDANSQLIRSFDTPMEDPADARLGRLTLAIAGLAAMVTYLDTTILFVAFPDISRNFGEPPASTLS